MIKSALEAPVKKSDKKPSKYKSKSKSKSPKGLKTKKKVVKKLKPDAVTRFFNNYGENPQL